jgi:hypothetical protein
MSVSKYYFVSLCVKCRDKEVYSDSVHKISPDATIEKQLTKIVTSFFPDDPVIRGKTAMYYGGEVLVKVHKWIQVPLVEYTILKKYL